MHKITFTVVETSYLSVAMLCFHHPLDLMEDFTDMVEDHPEVAEEMPNLDAFTTESQWIEFYNVLKGYDKNFKW